MPAKTLEAPARLPLYSPLATRTSDYPFTKDSRLYNGYVELDPTEKVYRIYKRLGLGPSQYSHGSPIVGLGVYTHPDGSAYGIVGPDLIRAAPGGSFGLTGQSFALDTSAAYFWEAMQNFVIFGNGVNTKWYNDAGNRGGTLTMPFSGNTAWGFAYLNGLLYVMDQQGNLWNTLTANDISSGIDPASKLPANNEPDAGVGIIKQLSYILAIKQYSTQVFYDAGASPGSPLGEVPDSQMPFGCLVGSSIRSIDGSCLWITANETISPQIIQVDNLVPHVVSTPNVDRILDEIAWNAPNLDVRSWVLKHAGHRFYGLSLTHNNITLVYDLDQLAWKIWTDPMGNYWPIGEMAYQVPQAGQPGIHIAQHISNGNIYQIDGDYAFPNDAGVVFPVDIYTPNFDAGIDRRKQINMLHFRGDQVRGSTLQVRYSDDDYQSWSNYRSVDLGRKRPLLANNGSFYRRAYHLRHQCNTTLRLMSVDMQLDIGSL